MGDFIEVGGSVSIDASLERKSTSRDSGILMFSTFGDFLEILFRFVESGSRLVPMGSPKASHWSQLEHLWISLSGKLSIAELFELLAGSEPPKSHFGCLWAAFSEHAGDIC